MELLLSIVALLAGVAALALAFQGRAELRRAEERLESVRREAAEARAAAADGRAAVEALRRELDELRAAVRSEKPLPLPGTVRGRGLEELREQLRALHESDTGDED